MGRCKKSNTVKKRGKLLAKKQLIDSSNEANQSNHNINEERAQSGGVGTRENPMISNLNHQNDQSQLEQQIQEGSHVEDTTGRRKRWNVLKLRKSQAKKQLVDSSNEANQSNHIINEEHAQSGGGIRENPMISNLNHQNDQSQLEQQIQEGNHVEPHISSGRINKSSRKGEKRVRGYTHMSNVLDMPDGATFFNAALKRGKLQATKQLIDSSNEANQSNHIINEEHARSGGVGTRENPMISNHNHQNHQSQLEQQIQEGSHVEDTMGRCKRLNAVQKRGKSQAKKQLIDSSNEANQSNHNINEECTQSGGGTRENPMISNRNHQNDQSQLEQQIQEGSHVEPHISSGIINKSLSKGEKRVRGYTRMSNVWDMPNGEFIRVEVDSLGNPIGLEGKSLLNAIGCLVRRPQCAPINCLSWKDMPEFYITKMLEMIQSKFQFVPELTEQTKQILKDNMSGKWRQFKHDLKAKGYDESKTEEEMAANILDARVDPSQYRALVHHWCSKKGQKISNINKRNRSKYEDLHCMGTKNLPRFIHEVTEANGVQPSRARIYIDTRTRKDGSIVTEKAATVIDELKKHMVVEATSSQNPQTTQDSTNWKNDIYSKVLGPEKKGHVRCLGKIPRHADSNASSSSNVEFRLQKLENLLGNLVSVLQTRFSADQQITDVLQAIAQEVPDAPSTPNDSTSNNQQNTGDSNY